MDNEVKSLLMEYLRRFADHYEINASATSFKKRTEVLDQLKNRDHNAWVVITELIDAFIREDRVRNDKEKYEKARLLWDSEHASAEKEKVRAEMQLIDFCKEQGITVGKIGQEV